MTIEIADLATLCFLVALEGCARPQDVAIERASSEFGCPRERVHAIERRDIAENLFDVEACGSRARYACQSGDVDTFDDPAPDLAGPRCFREPDPPAWDPDPATAAALSPELPAGVVRR